MLEGWFMNLDYYGAGAATTNKFCTQCCRCATGGRVEGRSWLLGLMYPASTSDNKMTKRNLYCNWEAVAHATYAQQERYYK